MQDDTETTAEGPGDDKVDSGATDERKTEDPRGASSEAGNVPGPSMSGDQPDGTNENQQTDERVETAAEPDSAPERSPDEAASGGETADGSTE